MSNTGNQLSAVCRKIFTILLRDTSTTLYRSSKTCPCGKKQRSLIYADIESFDNPSIISGPDDRPNMIVVNNTKDKNKRSVLRRQSGDTNRNTKRSVYCQYV